MSFQGMDDLLLALRAAAEPTRLRILALAARGAFNVTELVTILGQSQPRRGRRVFRDPGPYLGWRRGAVGLAAGGAAGNCLWR